MKEITRYFTFGLVHNHQVAGHTFDSNTVAKITSDNPRRKAVELFGIKWAFEYDEAPTGYQSIIDCSKLRKEEGDA